MESQQIKESKKRSIQYLQAQEIAWRLKSKADFIQYLDKHLQYYLPPPATIKKDFLKQVLAEEKQLLKKDEVVPVEVPCYDELSVKALYPQFLKDPAFTKYFADSYP